MLKISGKVKGLPEVFVKSKSIIVDNEDDRLCWYRFFALCLHPELRNTKINNIKTRTQRAKSILLAEHNIKYSNHMTQADKKRAPQLILNADETSVEVSLPKKVLVPDKNKM